MAVNSLEAALEQFILAETERTRASTPYPEPFYEVARRLLTGIRDMLPERRGVLRYQPEPQELRRKMVVASCSDRPEELVIGILLKEEERFTVRSLTVEPPSVRPLTREDIDLGLRVLDLLEY